MAKDVEPPEELLHTTIWYKEIRRQQPRGWNFEPISFTEIEAYARLFRLEMEPFDVSMLLMLDAIWQNKQPPPTSR